MRTSTLLASESSPVASRPWFPTLRRLVALIKDPVSAEMREILRQRWAELPPELQTDWQVVGRHLPHCGYTLGPSYCSFGCSHCYLPSNANRVPIPSLVEMREQIDANRRALGPGGRLQITGGDVVDAYWRADRAGELVEVLRYASDAGLVPMLMTHGQVLLDQPDYFARLITEGGLRKVALHIDVTQAGRPGYPIREVTEEADLHPLREAFVDLIHDVRRRTGVRFHAAHTVTVTEENLAGVGEIVRWLMASSRRLDAIRMVSFQTEAAVGRTRFSARPVTPAATWREVCEGAGVELSRDNLWFGHPACSNMTCLLALYPEGRVIDLIPGDAEGRRLWSELLRVFGGLAGRGEKSFAAVLGKILAFARHPAFLVRLLGYIGGRLRPEGVGLLGLARRWLKGDARSLTVVLHNFMHASELQEPRSEEVTKRLAACSFRGAVRRDGEWQVVSMCEMNAGPRAEIYDAQAGRDSGSSAQPRVATPG